jgi:hypothetical protein
MSAALCWLFGDGLPFPVPEAAPGNGGVPRAASARARVPHAPDAAASQVRFDPFAGYVR